MVADMKKKMTDTIFALSTFYGPSAIAIIRISGPESLKIAKKLCKIENLKHRFANLLNIFDLQSNLIDKGLVIYFKSPKSFTGEDLLEIQTHGSVAIIKKLIGELSKLPNARPAKPGELSKRAFLNGKGDMLYFEGINNLIKSETENQRLIASKQTFGKDSNKCLSWRQKILEILAFVDAEIEFGDEIENLQFSNIKNNIKKICKEIEKAIKSFLVARNLVHGSRVLIIGPVNAGKSTFFNFLLQNDKMIVSPKEGTTTDQSDQSIDLLGEKVIITDTAGIRNTKNEIEGLGVKKTILSIKTSQKIIIVLSPDSLIKDNLEKVKKVLGSVEFKNSIIIFNKSDLKNSKQKFKEWKIKIPAIKNFKSMTISCRNNTKNIKMLKKCQQFIHDNLLSVDTNTDDYYFSELRQFECLKSILKNLECANLKFDSLEILAKYLRDALTDIDELYGKHDDEDKLEIIFNKFCIGK